MDERNFEILISVMKEVLEELKAMRKESQEQITVDIAAAGKVHLPEICYNYSYE